VGDNPCLADFYGNMPQWSFHLQIFFLGHRAEQHRGPALAPESAICDRRLFEDCYIFARALRALRSLSERD
jgi:deoxyadenosine/deoxycytidine kinase